MLNSFTIGRKFIFDFEPYWFNDDKYQEKFLKDNPFVFEYKIEDKEICWTLYPKNDSELVSPLRASFGGPEFSDAVDLVLLSEFIREVLAEVKLKGFSKISVICPPESYNYDKADLVDEALLLNNFQVSVTEFNYHIPVKSSDFESFVHDSEKRRLKKCLEAGFTFQKEVSPDFEIIYDLIVRCRKRKGFPLTMNKEEFTQLFIQHPDRYLQFTVKNKHEIIATATGVKVRSDILYSFLPADEESFLSYSPSVLLHKGIYDYCLQNNFTQYDLGIASSGGIINEGLLKFKEHLGGLLSHKYTYERVLS